MKHRTINGIIAVSILISILCYLTIFWHTHNTTPQLNYSASSNFSNEKILPTPTNKMANRENSKETYSDNSNNQGTNLPSIQKNSNVAPNSFNTNIKEPSAPLKDTTAPLPTNPIKKKIPTLFIVIDDVGYDLESLLRFATIDVPITFAILPYTDHARGAARIITEHNQQYIVHIPMEPYNSDLTDPHAILVSDSNQVIETKLLAMISEFPHVVGANNHMGSLATTNSRIMRVLFEVLKQHDIFFVNSMTSASNVGKVIAQETGVVYFERNVFLDHVVNFESILNSLHQGLEYARHNGAAILIGHVSFVETFDALSQFIAETQSEAVKFEYIANYDNSRN